VTKPDPDGARPWIPRSARALRRVVVALLVLSTALTLAWLPALRAQVGEGRWPRGVLAIPPALLGAFICGYAAYRFALVRAGRYPAGKALAQLALMLLALGVVTGFALDPVPVARRPDRIERGMRSGDPDARALAAELARHRPIANAQALVPLLVDLLDDADGDVRGEARASLVAITGQDMGEGTEAAARWRARLAEPGPGR
jgi:hypothetical protein